MAMFSAGEGEGMCGISTPLTHSSQQRVRRPLELALVRSQGCPGWVVESVPRLGGHKTPALSYLSGKWRYTKTLKESTVYETPYRVSGNQGRDFICLLSNSVAGTHERLVDE